MYSKLQKADTATSSVPLSTEQSIPPTRKVSVNSAERQKLTLSSNHPETPNDSPSLVEQLGYSSVNDNHAYSSLQRSLRPHPGMSLANGPMPRSMVQAYFKERYCQLASQLPSYPIIKELIDLYYSDIDWYFMCLDRWYTEDLLESWKSISVDVVQHQNLKHLSRELHYFPALLFQLMAVTLQFLPLTANAALCLGVRDSASLDRLSESYSRTGLAIMALLGRQQPTITSVEHDLLRLNWLKNCSRGTEAWHSLNHAVRQAQLLGLHLEPKVRQEDDESVESTLTRLWYAEHKRRVWARLFLLDSFMSLILGRPRLINKDDCSVAMPIDRDFPETPSRTVFLPPSWSPDPSSTTPLIYLCTLGLKIHDMLSARAGRTSINDNKKVIELQESIHSILNGLPRALQAQNPDTSWDARYPHFPKTRQQMVSLANSLLMTLHRPHVDLPDSRGAAIECALKVLESQQAMFELMSQHQYKLYGYSFYTIDAGIFLASLLIERPPETRAVYERVQGALQDAISRLGTLGTRISIARTGELVLKQCLPKIQHPARPDESSTSNLPGNITPNSVLFPPTTSLHSRSAPSVILPATQPPPYRPVDETFDFPNFSGFDLQSMPPPLDAAGFTNYFESANGLSWSAYNNNNSSTRSTSDTTNTAAGDGVTDYSADTAPVHLDGGGMDLFSYGFDEYPYFFFNAALQDQDTGPWQ